MQGLTINLLFKRLEQRGTGAYGLSSVTQLEHALQSAALANQTGMSEHMVVAALFHDIGHLVSDDDINLQRYFKDGIALRRIDDQAKVPGLAVPELESYRSIAQQILLTAIE